MEAKELRIGNIVKLDPIGWSLYKNELFKVVSIEYRHNDYKVYLNFADGRKWPVTPNLATSIEFIKPVKLTEELLTNCNINYSKKTKQFSFKSFDGNVDFETNGLWLTISFDWNDFLDEIHYLHELQNTYFTLTKQEMELKL